MKYKHLFGPVVSRRLGISLGVDVVPYKYCSLNCVYCEVSRTTHLTLKRKSFYDVTEITGELDDFLKSNPRLDYITFSGAGEPTLNSDLGEIISFIKTRYPQYKLALITNSTLFDDPEVRSEILPCDLILPSLDAVSEEGFEKINRPIDKLLASNVIIGLKLFRAEYPHQIWLEIFIVPGINDSLEEIELLKEAVGEIKPDKVQLNSLDRPGAENWVEPAVYLALEEIRAILQEDSEIPVEIIAKSHQVSTITVSEENVLKELIELIKTDEYSKAELARELQIHVNEVSKLLQHLAQQENITVRHKQKGTFYLWKK
jgi:wyosine [tRNA(Phe)-imidazoG37] synthetase (radical SAM superfamily)